MIPTKPIRPTTPARPPAGLPQLVGGGANYGRAFPPVWLRELETGPLAACDGPDEEGAKRRRDEVLDFVRESGGWTAAREVEAFLTDADREVDVRTVRRDLNLLVASSELHVMTGANRTKLYRAPTESDVGHHESDKCPTGGK